MASKRTIVTNRGFVRAEFNFYVGKYLDKMYDAFENKELIGNQCPKCNDVFFPPRKICGKCNVVIPLEENWVDLPDTGAVVSYTATPYKITERGSRTVKKNRLLGLVKIDDTNTAVVYKLLKMKPEDVEMGMKVKVEWVDKPKGEPMDIKGFVKV